MKEVSFTCTQVNNLTLILLQKQTKSAIHQMNKKKSYQEF